MIREATNIVGDIRGIASTGVRAVRTRLELIAIELKEEKAWLVRFIVLGVASVYLISFGTLLAILAVSLAMPESARPAVLGGVGGFLLAAGIGAVIYILQVAKKKSPPFQDTIATLKRDEQSLGGTGE